MRRGLVLLLAALALATGCSSVQVANDVPEVQVADDAALDVDGDLPPVLAHGALLLLQLSDAFPGWCCRIGGRILVRAHVILSLAVWVGGIRAGA